MLALKHCGFLSDHAVKTPRFSWAEFGRTKIEELNHFGQCFKIVSEILLLMIVFIKGFLETENQTLTQEHETWFTKLQILELTKAINNPTNNIYQTIHSIISLRINPNRSGAWKYMKILKFFLTSFSSPKVENLTKISPKFTQNQYPQNQLLFCGPWKKLNKTTTKTGQHNIPTSFLKPDFLLKQPEVDDLDKCNIP